MDKKDEIKVFESALIMTRMDFFIEKADFGVLLCGWITILDRHLLILNPTPVIEPK